jgi:hypothetical protein
LKEAEAEARTHAASCMRPGRWSCGETVEYIGCMESNSTCRCFLFTQLLLFLGGTLLILLFLVLSTQFFYSCMILIL